MVWVGRQKVNRQSVNRRLSVDQRTIFVWLHWLDSPKKVLKSQVEANHFTILEPCLDDRLVKRSEMFIFQDSVWDKEIRVNPIILSIPDSVLSYSEATDEKEQLEKLAMRDAESDSCGDTMKSKWNTQPGKQMIWAFGKPWFTEKQGCTVEKAKKWKLLHE
jgi:hypothetical protein